jgi:hypothetical protein
MNTNLQWINERIKQGLPTAVETEKEEVNIDFGLSYSSQQVIRYSLESCFLPEQAYIKFQFTRIYIY